MAGADRPRQARSIRRYTRQGRGGAAALTPAPHLWGGTLGRRRLPATDRLGGAIVSDSHVGASNSGYPAVIEALTTVEQMGWRGLWVRVDGEISAFAIMSHLTPEMGVLNFEKAYPAIKGLYQFLDNECARQLFQGYLYMNKESDMGIPALADSKKSYHPVEKLKSYCLKIRE